MTEYIEREALLKNSINGKRFVFQTKDLLNEEVVFKTVYKDLFDFITSVPAADVAPVVRCKDCIHRIIKNMGWNIGEVGGCEIFNVALPCDFFCAYGERKEGAE